MAPRTNKLPLEIWGVIISQVEGVKELARCRLVCKAWGSFAEAAMLGQKLELTNNETVTKFCEFLTKKKQLARHIKSLRLNDIDQQHLPLQKKLLCLSLTPNIRELKGKMGEKLYGFLLEIAQGSQQKFDKLQSLPEPSSAIIEKYVEALLFFKDSLCELKVSTSRGSFEPVLDHLDEFKDLIKLDLKYTDRLDNLIVLENILQKCNRLQDLGLHFYKEGNHSMAKEELEKWLLRNVKKVPDLHTLHAGEIFSPDLVEYLVYKYPNVSRIVIGPFVAEVKGSAARIMDAVKDTDFVGLFKWEVCSMIEFRELISKMKSKRNQVKIQHYFFDQEDGGTLVDITKSKHTETTHFNIQMKKNVLPLSYEHTLSLIGSVNSLIIEHLSYKNEQDSTESSLSLSFYSLLKVIPKIEILEFTDRSIGYSASLLNSLVLDRLTSLKICGAIVDRRMFPKLSKIAPNLRHLTLNTCVLDLTCHRSYDICLPQTDLKKLSILTTNSVCFLHEDAQIKNYLHGIQNSIKIRNNIIVFLQITTESGQQVRYYYLQARTPSFSMQISKEIFQGNVVGWPTILINCRSLESLKINLGALVISLKFGTQVRRNNREDA